MEDVLLSLATLSVPCVVYSAISPSFTLDAAGWAVVGVCCAWFLYVLVVYFVVARTDWDLEALDVNANFAAVHGLLFAAYVVDNFVSLDLAQQIVMGILVWLIGGLAVGLQWRLMMAGPLVSVNTVVALSGLALVVLVYYLGCLSGSVALGVGIAFVVVLFLSLQYVVYGERNALVQMAAAFWLAMFIFQQAVSYCPHNAMLWLPLVVFTVAAFFRFAQALLFRVVSGFGYGKDPESALRRQLVRLTLLYFVILCVNLVGFAMFISGDRTNVVVDVLFFLFFLLLILFQYAFVYYARDALLLGGFYLMVSLTPLAPVGGAPGWVSALIYVLGALVALIVWSRPLIEGTEVRPWFYSLVFSFFGVAIGLAYWGALFATKRAPGSVLDYVQCGIGVAAYSVLALVGAVRSRKALGWISWIVVFLFVLSAALQIGFSIQNVTPGAVLLIVYGVVLLVMVVGLYTYREYEIHNENEKRKDE